MFREIDLFDFRSFFGLDFFLTFWPAVKGDLEIVKLLVQNRAELNPKDNRGLTPLKLAEQRATIAWDEHVVEYLMEKLEELKF